MIKFNIIWYNMLVDFYLVYYVVYFFFIYRNKNKDNKILYVSEIYRL